jgi:hypothetical protein
MGEKRPVKFSLTNATSTSLSGIGGFTFPPKEGMLRNFSPEKSDGFGILNFCHV